MCFSIFYVSTITAGFAVIFIVIMVSVCQVWSEYTFFNGQALKNISKTALYKNTGDIKKEHITFTTYLDFVHQQQNSIALTSSKLLYILFNKTPVIIILRKHAFPFIKHTNNIQSYKHYYNFTKQKIFTAIINPQMINIRPNWLLLFYKC